MEKPPAIRHAQLALWLWTLWVSLYGIYDTNRSGPELIDFVNTNIEGYTLTSHQILMGAIIGYGALALFSAFVIYKIGKGKKWARGSLVAGFLLELAMLAMPPYHIADLPDIGLQAYALFLLYSAPARSWFNTHK
jgi:hypothetical protein